MCKIYMISGYRNSGKDTLGNLIIELLGPFKRFAFADELKNLASKKSGFARKLADIREEKDKPRPEYAGKSIRDLGREVWLEIKKTNPTLFSEDISNKMKDELKKNPKMNFVITDFRYEFDYNKLVENFYRENIVTVRINRRGIEIPDEESEPEEHALKNFTFDITIDNNGTLEELWENFLYKIKTLSNSNI